MARQENPAARNALVGRSPASAGRGCPSLWFVSLGQAREMNERPSGRDTPPNGGKECQRHRGTPRAKPHLKPNSTFCVDEKPKPPYVVRVGTQTDTTVIWV